MATINKTETTRATELTALLEFAREMDYAGSTVKLEKMLASLNKGGSDATRSANLALAHRIAELMEIGKDYTNAEIREMPVNIPVGSRGKVEASKVSAILRVGVAEGLFTKNKIGSTTIYALA